MPSKPQDVNEAVAKVISLGRQLEAALELFNRSQARLADLEMLTLRQQARIVQLEEALDRECAAHDRTQTPLEKVIELSMLPEAQLKKLGLVRKKKP